MDFYRHSLLMLLFCCAAAFSLHGRENIIASWDFTGNPVLTGRYAPVLRGSSKLSAAGLLNNGSDIRKPGGAAMRKAFPELSPKDAFEISAGIILDGEKKYTTPAMIYDSKYVAVPTQTQSRYHKGFMFFLAPRGKNVFRPGAAFGFGTKSVQVFGRDVTLAPGVLHNVAMYFSATGKVVFYVNGKVNHTVNTAAGKIAASDMKAAFADRIGANYWPLGGTLKNVVIRKKEYEPVIFAPETSCRRVFERLEKKVFLHLELCNFSGNTLKNITLYALSDAQKHLPVKVAELNSGKKKKLQFAVNTDLLPGSYFLECKAVGADGTTLAKQKIEYTIVPSYGDFMPVLLWGNHDDIKDIKSIGFTHQIVHLFPRQGNFDRKQLARWIPHLDANLKEGLYTFGTLHSHFRFLKARRFLRTDRNGKIYPRPNLEASNPAARKEFAEAARTTLQAVGTHPAFDGALINSEVRDSSLPSFGSGVEPAAFKKFAGFDIPESISGKSPMPYAGNPAFPWDRVIPDNYKDLLFLRWFWETGDGWNTLQSLLSGTMHDTVKKIPHKQRFFTFYDPATRVPPLWGSGGKVDMIGQWTYSYPDPIKIGQAADELIAMADGTPGQKIGVMTQAIWYRSHTAPVAKRVQTAPAWLAEEKEAPFISIAPDLLREAFWTKISRRIDAIMYHGVGSLIARTDHKLYRMTNYESRKVLKELSEKVIVPLGPVLKRIPERPFEVAILESAAASFYAPQHFPFGWSKNWTADLHLALQWGHFQPGIIYDQHLLHNKNTAALKVLFVPGLEVVTEPVLAKLNELRSRGVIIIGDEFTLPALMVDYRIKSVKRDLNAPLKTKKELQNLGKEMAELLAGHFKRRVTASNQDIVVRQRGNDKADYVFVINDKRTFGNYVGQWGMVPEKGLRNTGVISVAHPAAAACDLVRHRQIKLEQKKNGVAFNVDLAPGDGTVVLLLERPIDKVLLEAPRKIKRGTKFRVKCRITDKNGKNINAVLPVKLQLTDSAGRILPGSGFYAADKGSFSLNEIMAPNAAAGRMKLELRCLASGKTATAEAEIQ